MIFVSICYRVISEESKSSSWFDEAFEYSLVTTMISLGNESLFNHLEVDQDNSNLLLACLDNAVSQIDIDKQTATAYAGLPNFPGYVDGPGTEARFRTTKSLAQINQHTIIISDQDNYCLRHMDRKTKTTSTFAGKCTINRLASGSTAGTAKDMTLNKPGALLFDNRSDILYVVDDDHLHRINMSNNTAYSKVKTESYLLSSLLATVSARELLITTLYGIATLDVNTNTIKLLSGSKGKSQHENSKESRDGNLTGASFVDPRAIRQYEGGVYLVAEYGTHKIRILDLER